MRYRICQPGEVGGFGMQLLGHAAPIQAGWLAWGIDLSKPIGYTNVPLPSRLLPAPTCSGYGTGQSALQFQRKLGLLAEIAQCRSTLSDPFSQKWCWFAWWAVAHLSLGNDVFSTFLLGLNNLFEKANTSGHKSFLTTLLGIQMPPLPV